MTRLITGLGVHRYARAQQTAPAETVRHYPLPGITTIKQAKARLFARWQPGHQVTITVTILTTHQSFRLTGGG